MGNLDIDDGDYYTIVVKKNDTRLEYDSKSKNYHFSVKSQYSLNQQAAEDFLECLAAVITRVNAREDN